MTDRFSRVLTDLLPRTGRIIAEDGTSENEADIARFEQTPSIQAQSLKGTLYRGYWEGSIANATTRDFVLDIPPGFDLLGFVRSSQVRDSAVTTRLLTCTGFTSAEGPILGKSLDRRTGRKSNSQGAIHRASALTGALQHSPEIELSVQTATATRVAAIQTEAGALPAFDAGELPAFRYTNNSGSTARLSLYLFWAELPQG